jgi:hypothetical protein
MGFKMIGKEGIINTVTFVNSSDVRDSRSRSFKREIEAYRVLDEHGFPDKAEVRSGVIKAAKLLLFVHYL